MLITPEYVFKDVTHITPEFLAGKGIRALVLDIDNTLTADRSQELPDEVAGWLAQMRKPASASPSSPTVRRSASGPSPRNWDSRTSTVPPSPCPSR